MHLLLCLVLTAAPAAPVKLAAPGFSGGNVPADVVSVASEHFAQQLALQGFRVVTGSEIQAALGVERQRQLLGCTTDGSSCLAELSAALGVDGVITGSLGRFGTRYTVNVKVVRSSDAKQLSVFSATVDAESMLPDVLTRAAHEVATEVRKSMGLTAAPTSEAPPSGGTWSQRKRTGAVTFGIAALVGIISIVLDSSAYADFMDLRNATTQPQNYTLSAVAAFHRHDVGQAKLVSGVVLGAAAVAGLIVGGSLFFSTDPQGAIKLSFDVGPQGFGLALGGPLP